LAKDSKEYSKNSKNIFVSQILGTLYYKQGLMNNDNVQVFNISSVGFTSPILADVSVNDFVKSLIMSIPGVLCRF